MKGGDSAMKNENIVSSSYSQNSSAHMQHSSTKPDIQLPRGLLFKITIHAITDLKSDGRKLILCKCMKYPFLNSLFRFPLGT